MGIRQHSRKKAGAMLKIKYTQSNIITTKHDNLSKQVKKCPFCGKGFTFYKTEFDRNDGYHGIEQYFLHDNDDKMDCILDQMWNGGFSIGAGDANIHENYIGEYATKWNEQLTAGLGDQA